MSKDNKLEASKALFFEDIKSNDIRLVEGSLHSLRRIDISKIYNLEGLTPLLFAVINKCDIKIIKAIAEQSAVSDLKSAANSALDLDHNQAVPFFIQQGCYNLASNSGPVLIGTNSTGFRPTLSQWHLTQTRKLYTLLSSGTVTLQAVEELVRLFAIPTDALLQTYIARKNPNESQIEIEKVLRYIIEKGVKVNKKFHETGHAPITPLQIAVNMIASDASAGQIIDKRATYVAIALLKNSAGFNLDEAQKVSLVKGALKHDPQYIKTLLTKGWIKKDFQVDGVEIARYAEKNTADKSLIEFIDQQPLSKDLTFEKKRKALVGNIFGTDMRDASSDVYKNLKDELVAGVHTSGAVHFSIIKEDNRTKKFLEKPTDSVAQHFGNQLLRVLSNQQYVIKRGVLIADEDGKPYFATKWDDAVAGNYFLENGAPKKIEDKEFIQNYARLCGVVHVLGEYDWNSRNFLKSDKNGKPVKIDNAPLVSGYNDSSNPQRIYGSNQSRVFLHFLAGEEIGEVSKQSAVTQIRAKLDSIKKSPNSGSQKSIEAEAKAFIDGYKEGVDDKLLVKIKSNLAKDPNLKAAFIEFMAGIKDAIDLAGDTKFLEDYSAKYQQEIKVDTYKTTAYQATKICRQFLQQNADEAQKQFKTYLAYYKELDPQRYDKMARNIGDPVTDPQAKIAPPIGQSKQTADDLVRDDITLAIIGKNQPEIELSVEVLKELSTNADDGIERKIHVGMWNRSSPLQKAVALDNTDAVNYFLESGFYDLQYPAKYIKQDDGSKKSSLILYQTHTLVKLLGGVNVVATVTAQQLKSGQQFANLKSLIKTFSRSKESGEILASEGKSFLQLYVENLKNVNEKNLENVKGVLGYFQKNGLDINATVKNNDNSLSLLQHVLSKTAVDKSNAFIAIALLESGAQFNNLTNLQKSRLVRAVVSFQPLYLKNLLKKGVVNKTFVLERDGEMQGRLLGDYVKNKLDKTIYKGVLDLFDPAHAIKTGSLIPVLKKKPVVATVANAAPAAAAVTKGSSSSDNSDNDSGVGDDTENSKLILNKALKTAADRGMIQGVTEKVLLKQFSSGFRSIKLTSSEQAARHAIALAILYPNKIPDKSVVDLITPKKINEVFSIRIGDPDIDAWIQGKVTAKPPAAKPATAVKAINAGKLNNPSNIRRA